MRATDHSTTVEDPDWQQFRAAYLPESGRRDLKAIVAYGAYRRSLAAGDQRAREAAPLQEADGVSPEAMSLEEREDEGGGSHEPHASRSPEERPRETQHSASISRLWWWSAWVVFEAVEASHPPLRLWHRPERSREFVRTLLS